MCVCMCEVQERTDTTIWQVAVHPHVHQELISANILSLLHIISDIIYENFKHNLQYFYVFEILINDVIVQLVFFVT